MFIAISVDYKQFTGHLSIKMKKLFPLCIKSKGIFYD